MKHMKSSKLFALLMAVAILLGIFGLASCGNGGKDPALTSAPESKATPADQVYRPNVPDGITFDGADFDVLGMDPALYGSSIVDFDFENDPGGDVVSYAIFKRNRRIESEYDIVFRSDYDTIEQMSMSLQEEVTADEDTYKLIMLISREAFPLTLDGYVMPYSSIPYVDMSQPWYINRVNDAFKIFGYNVLAYTDECMNAYMQSMCVFFNMNIVNEQSNIENPYDLVEAGTWTLDAFYRLAEAAKKDVNGDDIWSAEDGDVFGVVSEEDAFFPATWVGAESYTITKDKRGIPEYKAYADGKLIGILEDLSSHLSNNGFFLTSWTFTNVGGGGDAMRNAGTQYFAQGGGLFRVGCVGIVQLLRDMEADFGIVPLPKYDENQKTYYSRTVDGWLHVAPASVRKTEMLGVIIEALGAESKNLVIPAFFDIALDNKYVRDEDKERTTAMLDMIFGNAVMDLGETIWMDYVRQPIVNMLSEGATSFTSKLSAIQSVVEENCINKAMAKITELKSGGE